MANHFDLVSVFKQLDPHEVPAIGGTTTVLRQLDPESKQLVGELGDRLCDERELGRHGNLGRILDEYQVPVEMRPTVEKIVDAVEADDLAVSLQRRMGTDLDRAPDPPTRVDEIRAAFDFHSQGEL